MHRLILMVPFSLLFKEDAETCITVSALVNCRDSAKTLMCL